MNKFTVYMEYEKATKGTHVYTESNNNPLIPTLYIRKEALPEKPPKRIEITVIGIDNFPE